MNSCAILPYGFTSRSSTVHQHNKGERFLLYRMFKSYCLDVIRLITVYLRFELLPINYTAQMMMEHLSQNCVQFATRSNISFLRQSKIKKKKNTGYVFRQPIYQLNFKKKGIKPNRLTNGSSEASRSIKNLQKSIFIRFILHN